MSLNRQSTPTQERRRTATGHGNQSKKFTPMNNTATTTNNATQNFAQNTDATPTARQTRRMGIHTQGYPSPEKSSLQGIGATTGAPEDSPLEGSAGRVRNNLHRALFFLADITVVALILAGFGALCSLEGVDDILGSLARVSIAAGAFAAATIIAKHTTKTVR